MITSRRDVLLGSAATLLCLAAPLARADTPSDDPIAATVEAFRTAFQIPGVGLALIRPGQPDLAVGYGVLELGRPTPVDAHSRFAIGSATKAFTAAALALLVEDGKLAWDDPVVRHLPEFRMYDPVATQMMTVLDLLVHRSGLGSGEGDLMLFGNFSQEEVLHGLAYLKPRYGFRAGYAYDNVLYIVAGLLVSRASGVSWQRFVTERLLKPLGMTGSATSYRQISGGDVAAWHARLGPPVPGMGPMKVIPTAGNDLVGPAGGIVTSPHDALAWLHVQLAHGALPNGGRLWSEQQQAELWTPRVITASGSGPSPAHPTRAVVQSYALGWDVQDYRGQRLIYHGGALEGQVCQHALLPETGHAVAIYTNQGSGLPVIGLLYALLDRCLGNTSIDWVSFIRAQTTKREAAVLQATGSAAPVAPPGGPSLPLASYVGRYGDPWFGEADVRLVGDQLYLQFAKVPAPATALQAWGPDAFRTRFTNGREDAVVTFTTARGRVTGITAKPLSPLADFSFDYQDLHFLRTS